MALNNKGIYAVIMLLLVLLLAGSLPAEAYAKTSYEALSKENAKLKKENAELKKTRDKLIKENKSQKGKIAELSNLNSSLSGKVKGSEGKAAAKDKQIKALKDEVKKLQEELDALQNSGGPIEEPSKEYIVKGLNYKGKTSVTESKYSKYPVTNLHYYELPMKDGYTIKIYVTEDYIEQYGLGYAYEETADMIDSIAHKRKAYPYKDLNSSLRFYFYTNNSGTPFPSNAQAFAAPEENSKNGVDTKIFVNGTTMPYDFRDTLHHEILHYFDFNTFMMKENLYETFEDYWGPYYRFWLIEGGAEYACYNFYTYPQNTKNKLVKNFDKNSREKIIEYALQQKGSRKNVLYDIKLDSFDDIYKASSNNYGVTYSLFWYLESKYGYDKIYAYVKHIAEKYKGKVITAEMKEATAKQFFGKTEEQLLKEWVTYFNYFNGKLDPYAEMKTGTANHIMLKGDALLTANIQSNFPNNTGFNFLLNVKEWNEELNYEQIHTFREKATWKFKLTAPDKKDVLVNLSGANYSDGYLNNGERMNAFSFNIVPEEQAKLIKGVEYTLVPIDNDREYKWIIPGTLKFLYQ